MSFWRCGSVPRSILSHQTLQGRRGILGIHQQQNNTQLMTPKYIGMQCIRRNLYGTVSRFSIGQKSPLPPRLLHASAIGLTPKKHQYFSSNRSLQQNATLNVASELNIPSPPSSSPKKKLKRKPARSPAAKTSLRRAAAKAQDEQSGMSSETSENHVTAICVADEFDMDEVVRILRLNGFPINPDSTAFNPDQVIHTRGVNNGDIFVFPSGTLVAWSLPEDSVTDLATKTLFKAAVNPNIKETELENLEFEEDPQRDHSSLKGDIITLGTKASSQSPR